MISYKWIMVGLCFLMLFVVTGANNAFGVLLLPMSAELGLSISSLALAATVSMLVGGVSQPVIGKLADTYGPKKSILVGVAVAGVSTLLLAFASFLWQVYLLYGVFFGFTWMSSSMTAATVLVSRWFAEKRSIALTILQSAYPMGWLCMVPIATWLMLNVGWRNSWLALGTLTLSALVIVSFLLKEPGAHTSIIKTSASRALPLRSAMKTRFSLLLAIIYFSCGFTDLPFLTVWVPISLKFGIDTIAASYTLGFMAAIVLLGTVVIGPLPEKLGNKIPFTLSYLIRTVALGIPLLLATEATYYAFTILLAFSFFAMTPILAAWLGEIFGAETVGSLLGFFIFVHSIGAAIGISVFSLLTETYVTHYPIFLVSLMLTLVSVACCMMIKSRNGRARWKTTKTEKLEFARSENQ
ncbi:MAG: MFS transporter [Candidatus Hodarchaeota archaeon]